MKRIILFGAPGSGKGTQADKLEKLYGYTNISTGNLIRAEVAAKSSIGLEVKALMERGELAPDRIIIELLKKRLEQGDIVDYYILDGFPRTINQAEELSRIHVDNEIAIYLKIGNESVVIERMLSRLTCSNCGSVFSLKSNPPRIEGRCDNCGGVIGHRVDDTEETFRNRIRVYREQTMPVIEYYREKGSLAEIDASSSIDAVFDCIKGVLH